MTLTCAVEGCRGAPLVVDGALCASHEGVAVAAPEIETRACGNCDGRGWYECRCTRDGDPGWVLDDGPRDPGDPEWVECRACGQHNTGEPVGRVRCDECGGAGRVEA